MLTISTVFTMDRKSRLSREDLRDQFPLVSVFAGELGSVGNRCLDEEAVEPCGETDQYVVVILSEIRTRQCPGVKGAHSGVGEGPVQQPEEQFAELSALTAGADRGGPVTKSHCCQCPLTHKRSLLVAQPLPGVRVLAEGKTTNEHPVEPPLEQSRHPIPPQGELHDDGVSPSHLLLLSRHILWETMFQSSSSDIRGDLKPLVFSDPSVCSGHHRVPLHGIKIRLQHSMPRRFQVCDSRTAQAAAEGPRFRVCAQPENSVWAHSAIVVDLTAHQRTPGMSSVLPVVPRASENEALACLRFPPITPAVPVPAASWVSRVPTPPATPRFTSVVCRAPQWCSPITRMDP